MAYASLTQRTQALSRILLQTQSDAAVEYEFVRVTKTHSVEKSLIRMLLNRYEQYGVIGRPVNDSKIKVYVDYGLQLFQILDLDENKQILRTNCWSMYSAAIQQSEVRSPASGLVFTIMHIAWSVELLQSPSKCYRYCAGPDKLSQCEVHSPSSLLVPPLSTTFSPRSYFMISLFFLPSFQICMLEFGSWTYDKDQLDLSWWRGQPPTEPMPYVDFSDYVPSNEWRTDGEMDVISGNTGKVCPCTCRRSCGCIIYKRMNIFVAFFVLLLLLAESTPSAVRKFPLIGIYFCLNMIMITLSTFLATLVIHLYFRGDRNGAVPACLRRFIIDGIGRLVFVRQHIPLPDVKKPTSQNTRREIGASAKSRRKPHLSSQVGNKFLVNGLWFGENGPRVGVGVPCYPTGYPMYADSMFDGRLGPPFGSIGPPLTGLNHETSFFDPCSGNTRIYGEDFGVSPIVQHDGIDHLNKPSTGYHSMSKQAPFEHEGNHVDPDPNSASSTATLESDVREVKRYVKMFVNHKKEIQRKGLIAMEWRTLAIVLDRLFFFLYITTIGIAVIVSVPGSTEPELSDDFRE
ncbi:uncharacterized protein DEA37_0008608 [Paragonimus westermani]|uniref:Neurotransmitter-gated ion-channel ligand-binding domain-containing protein n=1 Tax=Paragonimus westermani TaxID=34504 RepID=A0A5J4P463_9TREM|nr:uncharacterized protein DEA37_0008608 [Paragonimus westermani]